MTNTQEKLSPGSLVIERFGSPRAVEIAMARVSETLPPTNRNISNWKDGLVPAKYMTWLLSAAKGAGVKLTHKELIEGGDA